VAAPRPAPVPPAPVCGALQQRPCTLTERVPSCNPGLVENFASRRCEQPVAAAPPAPTQATVQPVSSPCGGRKQRICQPHERVPSCDPGMVANFASESCELASSIGAQPSPVVRGADVPPTLPVPAASAVVNGQSAISVLLANGGSFVRTHANVWTEFNTAGNAVFRFNERGRDEWSVYLHDPSRDTHIQLDLFRRKVLVSQGAGQRRDLYDIASAMAPATAPPLVAMVPAARPAAPAAGATQLAWVAVSNGALPAGAFVGGAVGDQAFHLCRTPYQGGLHPGKLYKDVCFVGWGGREIGFRQYEVMVVQAGTQPRWVDARDGDMPPGAVPGGNEGAIALYVCRAEHRGSWHPGKLWQRNCNVGLLGAEAVSPRYQVLVSAPATAAADVSPSHDPSTQVPRTTALAPVPVPAPAPTPQASPAGETRAFALANRTRQDVEVFRGGQDPARHYVGTVASGRVFSSEERVGEMFYFAVDGQWMGAYRIDPRARHQLVELPTLKIFEVD